MKKTICGICVLLSLFLCLPACGTSSDDLTFSMQVLGKDGQPLVGASVYCQDPVVEVMVIPGYLVGVTDENGALSGSLLGYGHQAITVVLSKEYTQDASQETVWIDFDRRDSGKVISIETSLSN